jgi:hypothetical protein
LRSDARGSCDKRWLSCVRGLALADEFQTTLVSNANLDRDNCVGPSARSASHVQNEASLDFVT